MKKDPVVIDVYSGVGGLSLGASRAGFRVAAAVEIDEKANLAHKQNFPKTRHIARDAARLTGKELLLGSDVASKNLDGLIGGPPCQGFSSIGHRDSSDPRNSLFFSFFRLVAETLPGFFVAENVLGVLDDRNRKIRERAFAQIPSRYEVLEPIVVHANKYGVPTSRTRVFFIGFDPSRVDALSGDDFKPSKNIKDVRVENALKDLPRLRASWGTEAESWRIVGRLGDSAYEKRIKGFIPKDVGDTDALANLRRKGLVSGFLGTNHSQQTIDRFAAVSPGGIEPISRYPRLDRKGYCPTLRAGTGPERGSYQAVRPIHPTSPRVISPREAARLQGFPDWFQFHPTKWHSFRQIGNSVSPIVAEKLLDKIFRAVS